MVISGRLIVHAPVPLTQDRSAHMTCYWALASLTRAAILIYDIDFRAISCPRDGVIPRPECVVHVRILQNACTHVFVCAYRRGAFLMGGAINVLSLGMTSFSSPHSSFVYLRMQQRMATV